MSENITLGQLLKVLYTNELVYISVEAIKFIDETIFAGEVNTFPVSLYEKYKNFPVITFFAAGDESRHLLFDEHLNNNHLGICVILAIPETYQYYKYSFKKLLDTIDKNEPLTIWTIKGTLETIVYEGVRKNLPQKLVNQLENREVVFAEKLSHINVENKNNFNIYIYLAKDLT